MRRFLLVLLPLSLSAFPLRFERSGSAFTARGTTFTAQGIAFPGGTVMTLAGGRLRALAAGASAGSITYLVGRERSNVPQYDSVTYREVYPGIDLVFHDASGRLEYDFRLRPGADPAVIRMRFGGAARVAIEGEDLVAGTLRQHRPVAYQEAADGRRPVAVRYRLHNGEVRFEVASYDRNLPLLIDPVLSYATYAGGNGAETGTSIAVDSSGNAYLAGNTDSTNFAPQGTAPRAFLSKLDAAGTNFTSMAVLGGATIDGMALDSFNNPIVTGAIIDAQQFPGATAGAYQAGNNGFVARFTQDATGFKLAFIATFAASPSAIALNPTDSTIYVTGAAGNTFRTTAGVVQPAAASVIADAFVLKLSADGARALYATYLGGTREDAARAIAVNAGGEAYIAGDTASFDFPKTPGASQPDFGGRVVDPVYGAVYGDAFVAKLNAGATHLVFSTYLGGKEPDVAYGIALDSASNAYVTGSTQSADFPTTPGTVQPKYAGGTPVSEPDPSGDAFLVKLTANGVRLWSTFLGGSSRDIAEAVVVDVSGYAVVTGATDSPDFPITPGSMLGCRFTGNPWVASVDASGAKLLASTLLPGSALDEPHALARNTNGLVYVAGDAKSRAFLSTPGAAQPAYGGGETDAFVARVDLSRPVELLVSCVRNAASFQAGPFTPFPLFTVAPGEIVSLFGFGLGPEHGLGGQPEAGFFPKILGGTQVFFDGVAAPLLYASPRQINAIVPYGIKSPTTQLTVRRDGLSDGPRPLPVAAAVPGIFTVGSSGSGQGAVFNEDGTYNHLANPAAKGSVIVFYAVGAGAMSPPMADGAVSGDTLPLPAPQAQVKVTIRGVDSEIIYAGAAPGYVSGLLQVNVRIPEAVSFGNSLPLKLFVGAQESQFNVTVAVK